MARYTNGRYTSGKKFQKISKKFPKIFQKISKIYQTFFQKFQKNFFSSPSPTADFVHQIHQQNGRLTELIPAIVQPHQTSNNNSNLIQRPPPPQSSHPQQEQQQTNNINNNAHLRRQNTPGGNSRNSNNSSTTIRPVKGRPVKRTSSLIRMTLFLMALPYVERRGSSSIRPTPLPNESSLKGHSPM